MSPPAACAKTATESRLTFVADGVRMAGVFAILKALMGALLAAIKPRASLVVETPALRAAARGSAPGNTTAKAASD
jgi:hypothetical protein